MSTSVSSVRYTRRIRIREDTIKTLLLAIKFILTLLRSILPFYMLFQMNTFNVNK